MAIDMQKGQLAYDIMKGGLRFQCWYPKDKGDALVEITKDGDMVKRFGYPAYKVWNIAAHAGDIAADMSEGLAIAGSDGLGGMVVPREVAQ